jgi:hypothetical protein
MAGPVGATPPTLDGGEWTHAEGKTGFRKSVTSSSVLSGRRNHKEKKEREATTTTKNVSLGYDATSPGGSATEMQWPSTDIYR